LKSATPFDLLSTNRNNFQQIQFGKELAFTPVCGAEVSRAGGETK
jgi:hypothetical protein